MYSIHIKDSAGSPCLGLNADIVVCNKCKRSSSQTDLSNVKHNDYYIFIHMYYVYARRPLGAEMGDIDPFQPRKEPSRKPVVDLYEGVPEEDSGVYMVPTMHITAGPSTYGSGTAPSSGYGRNAGPSGNGTGQRRCGY